MLNVIENKTFTGEMKTIEITENTVIKHCQFINCLPGINDDIIRVIGKNVTVDIQYCTFDQSFINPDQYDEIISAINGPTINIYKSTFTGVGKVILCGNGDYPYSEEKTLNVNIKNCVFNKCSRRIPFFRYGTLYMDNCTFIDWGHTLYLKSAGIRLSSNAKGIISNCDFYMTKMIQSTFLNFIKDWMHQFTFEMYFTTDELPNKNIFQKVFAIFRHPIRTLINILPGACKGIVCENTSKVKVVNCKKNRWWIYLDS